MDKLRILCIHIIEVLCKDEKKNEKYISFLEKHKLPNSGPTPELLNLLNQEQKEELINIIKYEKKTKSD